MIADKFSLKWKEIINEQSTVYVSTSHITAGKQILQSLLLALPLRLSPKLQLRAFGFAATEN